MSRSGYCSWMGRLLVWIDRFRNREEPSWHHFITDGAGPANDVGL